MSWPWIGYPKPCRPRAQSERCTPEWLPLARPALAAMSRNLAESGREIARLEELMYRHARNLEFEQAAAIRDQIEVLRKFELELGEAGGTAAAAR